MKKFIFLCLFFTINLTLNAQDYVVQIAAFSEPVAADYFSSRGLEGVYMELDHNMIRRYYLGPYGDDDFASRMARSAQAAGFQYARVVNMTQVKEQCALSCSGATPVDGAYYDGATSIVGQSDLFIRNLFFDFDRSALRAESTAELDKLYNILMENPTYKVELHAHTDWIGSDTYNDALSMRRGNKSRNYLLNKGISGNRLIVKKFGEMHPIAKNAIDGLDSETGRQLNRRVELRIVDSTGQILWDAVEQINVPSNLKVNK